MAAAAVIQQLDVARVPRGRTARFWLELTTNALGRPVAVPIIVVRGAEDGPVLGLTAALHGNELNGLALIHRLVPALDPAALRGTVVAVPVLNAPAFLSHRRVFSDGIDLNRIMPGKAGGDESEAYAHRLVERLNLAQFTCLIDLHTASFGRVNAFYVRADLRDPATAALARVQNAAIILHSENKATTLRGTAAQHGVTALTLEINDPHVIQPQEVENALVGVRNALIHFGLLEGAIAPPAAPAVTCARSYWLYTDRGGLLTVLPPLAAEVHAGEIVARLVDPFGDLLATVAAVEDGVVIGKSVNPVNQTGGRILHLGVRGDPAG